ncbi:TrkH family potassium uptake protein [Mesoplasma lactucae]|uniref:Sodium transporter n=1 Tax=Mesoplasma lactucae ATCC 49193 TaxID=81460 RepID=A0A291ISB9_9MOLU|nr:potassium transporter TrkG [Mesoplasma lactucae]ATG97606.1 sodium transporter [Mesoplasma lactucae ATCC 49193]ATZ19933.1 potassium uptake protein KtrB [Mesoplasma lactucae ATCC 49193]MCL8216797.1 Ktr system potassium uptake protein B [Mesoplasma lactucae ATCC 49193]
MSENNNHHDEESFSELESEEITKATESENAKLSKESTLKKDFDSLDHSVNNNEPKVSLFDKMRNHFSAKKTKKQTKKNLEKQTKKTSALNKLKNWWPLSKVSGRIFLIYICVIIAGMILLAIPGVVIKEGIKWDFLTSLFTTSSAFSDTGIDTVNPSADYSFWGQLIILFLIEMGGVGILTFKVVLYLALNKRISVSDAQLAQSERGSSDLYSAVGMIRDGFVWLTSVQILAMAILFFAFYFTDPAQTSDYVLNGKKENLEAISSYHSFPKALWFAVFHSTSAINNAGFDIVSPNSLQPYNTSGNVSYLIQITFLVEWVVGGLGYPTYHDLKKKIKAKRKGEFVPFSLFTKLNFIVYGTLFIAGPLAVFGIEFADRDGSLIFNNYTATTNEVGVVDPTSIKMTGEKPVGEAIMNIIFNTTSTRNAGFSTININDFNAGSKTVMGILMFIGSAPSSTAGGIRTTTLAVIILAINAIVHGRSKTTAFKKTIPDKTVKRAFGVFFLSALIVAIAIIICYADSHKVLSISYNGDAAIVELFMLVTSAYGTVGLNPFTASQTFEFGVLTKLVIIVMMFIGQFGISNTLLVFNKNTSAEEQYGYLEEEVVIG